MQWYNVIKKIGGKSYLYRQRTYREGGKVRTQSKYLGPLSDDRDWISKKVLSGTDQISPSANPIPKQEAVKPVSGSPEEPMASWLARPNPFWPNEKSFKSEKANKVIRRSGVSISALKGEYARVVKFLDQLGLDGSQFANIDLKEGDKARWKRKGNAYDVILAPDQRGSGRNRFKRHYRFALAHAMLDIIEVQRPTLFDHLRTVIDFSWFNTKLLVTTALLKSNEPHKAWATLQFIWSGDLPKSLEKQLGKQAYQKLQPFRPGKWRDEAADLIADVLQRGYKPSLARLSKDRSKAKASAKRALSAYRKLGPFARLSKKGQRKWKLYKKHEAKFLLAHHKRSRLEMLGPCIAKFHG